MTGRRTNNVLTNSNRVPPRSYEEAGLEAIEQMANLTRKNEDARRNEVSTRRFGKKKVARKDF